MSTAIARNFQIGIDPTPTNNFTLYQPATPDGTLRLGNGNTGITSSLLTLTSAGNLGIGTTSPAYKLDVNGVIATGSGANRGFFYNDGSKILLESSSTYPLAFSVNGAVRATLDSSGNLGLGVTPSAWTGSFKALQIGAQGGLSATSTGTFLSANWYTDGTNRYIGSGNATLYQQLNGQHAFYTAGSGTAGNAISFTQAMTLDASGRLGIGTTSPSGFTTNPTALVVNSATGTAYNASAFQAAPILTLYGVGGSGNATGTRFSQGGSFELFFGGVQESGGAAAFVFQGYSGSAYTERARIDSSGSFGVGTSSPSTYGRVVSSGGTFSLVTDTASQRRLSFWSTANGNSENAYIQVQNDGATTNTGEMLFATKNSGGTLAERARIDASGNLLVGTTSAISSSARAQFVGSQWQVLVRNSGAASGAFWRHEVDTNNTFYILNNNSNGVYITNGGTSWTGLSDERLKDIIEPITDAANKVSSLRAVIGKYKTDEQGKRRSFLIAQDVQAVLPEAVDATNPERLGVAYTDTIPLLVAAIKEQQVIIEQLKADVAALKGA